MATNSGLNTIHVDIDDLSLSIHFLAENISLTAQPFAQFRYPLSAKQVSVFPNSIKNSSWAQVEDRHGKGRMLRVEYVCAASLELWLEACLYEDYPYATFRCGVLNKTSDTLQLDCISPLATSQLAMGVKGLDGWVNGFHSWSFSGYVPHSSRQPQSTFGWLTAPTSQNTTTRYPHGTGQYAGEQVAALIDPGRAALVAGFIGVENQFSQVFSNGRVGHKNLILCSSLDQTPIAPGETIFSEWAILYTCSLPDPDPLKIYAEATARLTPARNMNQTPPSGWSGWYQYFAEIEQAHMETNQARLKKMRGELPLSLIQLDDGYQPAWGDWLEHNHKFPDGVQGWANRVKHDGFEAGLWLSPFTIDRESQFYKRYPEAVLRDARGQPTHGGFLINRWILGLDPTHPATQEYIARCIETITQEWGVQYLKLDFLYCGALPGQRYDAKKTRAQALRDGLTQIRNMAGEDITLLGCGCPAGPALGIVDIMRVGPDVAPYWTPRVFGISWPVKNDHSMPATRNALRTTIHRSWTHRRWWWLDADNILARTHQHMTADEVQTFLTLMTVCGSHIVLSDDLDKLSENRRDWVSRLLPVSITDTAQGNIFESAYPPIVWKHCNGAVGDWVLIGLANLSEGKQTCHISPSEIGLRGKVIVCNFWDQTISIQDAETLRYSLQSHASALLGIRALKSAPMYAGSTLHASMGMEVIQWEATATHIQFELELKRRASGDIWLHLPAPPRSTTVNAALAELAPAHVPNIYRLAVSFTGKCRVDITLAT